ncbi:hypothetical protein AERO8C_160004 [Aeromonas veronii]|uniref:Uncharacterized protein n=1 Tax=Aeromonas veronii TaxID=654 RepID=A0A653KYG5_AERVE|nr:hypothetical protein AERO8C_160004 [Aeromonas veronii]
MHICASAQPSALVTPSFLSNTHRISLFEGVRCVQTLVVMVFVLPGYGTRVIGRGLGRLAALQLSQ